MVVGSLASQVGLQTSGEFHARCRSAIPCRIEERLNPYCRATVPYLQIDEETNESSFDTISTFDGPLTFSRLTLDGCQSCKFDLTWTL
eukprot:scaffold338_cov361-Pavlova_lutheri.AAC.16